MENLIKKIVVLPIIIRPLWISFFFENVGGLYDGQSHFEGSKR
jgi:hypothetical protein